MTTYRIGFLIILMMVALLVSACGQSAEARGNSTDIFEVEIVQEDQEEIVESVIEEIKPVLIAIRGYGDRRSLVEYVSTACTTADGMGGPPKCKPGEAEGTLVEAFPVLATEGHFVRPEDIDSALDFVIKGLYAVYRPLPKSEASDWWPTGEYALLFDREFNDIPNPVTALVQDGKLVRLVFSIGMSPAQILNGVPVEQIIITPEQANAVVEDVLRSEGLIP
ncbi:MAG: hypothetical protein PVG14_19535 [Anaerolineales bacterium]|jgi:hypothetical protein